jgi:hypothetical protein
VYLLVAVAGLTAAMMTAAGCGSAPEDDEEARRVRAPEHGFSIIPPAGWTKSPTMKGSFLTFSGFREGVFAPNFSVTVADLHGTPELAMEAVRVDTLQRRPDYKVVDKDLVTIDGKKGFYLSGTFTHGQLEIHTLLYGFFSGPKYYTLTFTASAETFDTHKAAFRKCAESARMD